MPSIGSSIRELAVKLPRNLRKQTQFCSVKPMPRVLRVKSSYLVGETSIITFLAILTIHFLGGQYYQRVSSMSCKPDWDG